MIQLHPIRRIFAAQIHSNSFSIAMMTSKILNALGRCPLFRGLTQAEIETMMEGVAYRLVAFEKKDIYALTGYPCRYADIIVSGEMVARMAGLSGKSVEVSRLVPGNIIAPAFIFAQDKRLPVSVETDVDTQVLRMSPQELKRLIDTEETIRMNFIQSLCDIDVFLTRKMRILSLLTVREKVSYFILTAAKEQGSDTIRLDKSRQEIADSFGIQKFSLLRSMSELVEAGAIQVDGKTITIIDRGKM